MIDQEEDLSVSDHGADLYEWLYRENAAPLVNKRVLIITLAYRFSHYTASEWVKDKSDIHKLGRSVRDKKIREGHKTYVLDIEVADQVASEAIKELIDAAIEDAGFKNEKHASDLDQTCIVGHSESVESQLNRHKCHKKALRFQERYVGGLHPIQLGNILAEVVS